MNKCVSILFIFLIGISSYSCQEPKKDSDYFIGDIRYIDESAKVVKSASSHLLDLKGDNYGLISVYDSLLICWNPKLPKHFFKIVNVDTGEEIGSFCLRGQGPEDVVQANALFQLKQEDGELKTLIDESARNRLLKWNITRSIQTGKTVWDTIVPFTNKSDSYRTHLFVFLQSGDTILSSVNEDIISDYEAFTPYYERRLLSNDELLQNYFFYKEDSIFNSDVSPLSFFYTWDAIKPDGSKIAQVMRTLPQLNIIDTHTGKITGYRMKGGGDFSLVESDEPYDKVYYNWVHADDRFIYAVYWGKEQWEVSMEAKIPDLRTIYVFDWDGNLRYELQTDKTYLRIWVDPVRNRLYTQNHDTDEVYYIDLSELNL